MNDLINKLIPKIHLVIAVYALYQGYLQYEQHEIELTQITSQEAGLLSEIAVLEKKASEITEYQKRSEEYKLRVEQVTSNIEQVQKQLPADLNETAIMDYINSELSKINIKNPSLNAGKTETGQLTIGREFNIKATGTFLQFAVFFEQLGASDRIYNMKNLKLFTKEEANKGRFKMIEMDAIVEAYKYNPAFKADAGI